MKAAVYKRYGAPDVISITEVARPEISGDQVLVEVRATSVTTADWRMRASAFPGILWLPGRLMVGLFAPKKPILGVEFSGRVAAVGEKVTRFKAGDEVFGFAGDGAHAEYLAIAEDAAIALKPEGLSHEEAAAVPFGGLAALVFLRDFAKVKPGQKVLVAGASGGVGVFAVQLARHLGAKVTAITSTGNVDLVRSLGADHVVDYTTEDFTAAGPIYDVIIDTAGTTSFSKARAALNPNGVFVPLEFGLTEILQSLTTSMGGGQKVVIGVNGDTREDVAYLSGLLEKGELRPVIDSRYPLDRIADAHRRVESRHKTGSVVVVVDPPEGIRLVDGSSRPSAGPA